VKVKLHRGEIRGKVKTATVSYKAGQHHASINYEDELIMPL